jgi:hypothetical protein
VSEKEDGRDGKGGRDVGMWHWVERVNLFLLSIVKTINKSIDDEYGKTFTFCTGCSSETEFFLPWHIANT